LIFYFNYKYYEDNINGQSSDADETENDQVPSANGNQKDQTSSSPDLLGDANLNGNIGSATIGRKI